MLNSLSRYVDAGNFSPIIRSQWAASKASSVDPCWSQKHCMFLELSAANSIPASMFHRYSSSLFRIVPPSTLIIITGTRFTLFIFHNSHSRSKNMFSVLMLATEFGFSFIVISSICDHGRTSFYNFLLLSLPTHQIRSWRVDVPLGHLLVFTVRLSKIRVKTV